MRHLEAPDTLTDRSIFLVFLSVAVTMAIWLGRRIFSDLDATRTYEFLALATVLGLALYLLWMILDLSSVRYQVEEDQLLLRSRLRSAAIPLRQVLHLYRWRGRWTWSGEAQKDLGVEEIDLYPWVWLGPNRNTWVLVYLTPLGRRCAAAFRPSPALLVSVRDYVQETSKG